MSIRRRDILKGLAGCSALTLAEVLGCTPSIPTPPIEGEIMGGATPRGHRLWGDLAPISTPGEPVGILIVGAGAAGLSAAWRLGRAGYTDVLTLEMEPEVGGNASWGEGDLCAYPWGAHYLTAPPPEAKATRLLLEELGAITGYDAHGRPQFDEAMTCFAPEERIFYRGEWFPGLYLQAGASGEDLREWARFEALIKTWRYHRGRDGRRAFALPIAASSQDPDLIALDTLTWADYLKERGFGGERFWWMMAYATRDDYCALPDQISAWAGLHYYASRCLVGDPALDAPSPTLTWPQGNGFIMAALRDRHPGRIRRDTLVYDVRPQGDALAVSALDIRTGQPKAFSAQRVIFAGPRFLAPRILAPFSDLPSEGLAYGPWLVANLHVRERPQGRGAAPAWDNVLYHGRGVGYVTATHQQAAYEGPAVLTYYLPFASGDARAEAQTLLKAEWGHWRDFILGELRPAHPDLAEQVTRLDVKRYGHAMVRPTPGRLWGAAAVGEREGRGGIFLAHADLGLPLFEEAQDHGVRAAEAALASLGDASPSIRGL